MEPSLHLPDIKVSLQRSVQFIGYRSFAGSATLCTPKKRAATRRTMISFTFCPRPFDAAFFITVDGYFCSPYGNRSPHYPQASGKRKTLNQTARPFLTLMAGVISLRLYAIPYPALIAPSAALFRRIRLHTTETFCLFGLCPIKVRHNSPKFFIAVSCCDVSAAGTAMQPTRCHQVLGPDFLLCPSLHVHSPFQQYLWVRYKLFAYSCQ
jgi:hypothetical protein